MAKAFNGGFRGAGQALVGRRVGFGVGSRDGGGYEADGGGFGGVPL
jgi:hypothetical protein